MSTMDCKAEETGMWDAWDKCELHAAFWSGTWILSTSFKVLDVSGKETIKMCLKYVHCCDVERIHLSQNTIWRTANTVINIRQFHEEKQGILYLAELLSSCISFWRKAFLHGLSHLVYLYLFICFFVYLSNC